jgi:hypothetical protein
LPLSITGEYGNKPTLAMQVIGGKRGGPTNNYTKTRPTNFIFTAKDGTAESTLGLNEPKKIARKKKLYFFSLLFFKLTRERGKKFS